MRVTVWEVCETKCTRSTHTKPVLCGESAPPFQPFLHGLAFRGRLVLPDPPPYVFAVSLLLGFDLRPKDIVEGSCGVIARASCKGEACVASASAAAASALLSGEWYVCDCMPGLGAPPAKAGWGMAAPEGCRPTLGLAPPPLGGGVSANRTCGAERVRGAGPAAQPEADARTPPEGGGGPATPKTSCKVESDGS